MMRRFYAILIFFLNLITLTSVNAAPVDSFIIPSPSACGTALPTNHPGFCVSFKATATCYCKNSGLPAVMCVNMDVLYARLVSIFGTIEKACEYQKFTSPPDCEKNWWCYRKGKDTHGNLCRPDGKDCTNT